MSTVSELITWATHEAALRTYLGVATGEDDNLQLWLEAATQLADEYLERSDFTAPLLRNVELGVYELVKLLRSQWLREFSATKVKTDALEAEYNAELKKSPEFQQVAVRFWNFQSEFPWYKA